MTEPVNDPIEIKEAVRPFLEQNLVLWAGLPRTTVETLSRAISQPIKMEQGSLGWYPAERYTFRVESPAGGLIAYARHAEVVLIEALVAPPFSVTQGLGEPTAILPHEILSPLAYVHEYLYCERGLVLSVAEPFQEGKPMKIVRARGIPRLHRASEFGPEFYQAFQDQIAWQQV